MWPPVVNDIVRYNSIVNLDQAEMLHHVAAHCARTHPASIYLAAQDRYDAAYDSIAAYVADNGWPADSKSLFLAGSAGIKRCHWENTKHLKHWYLWIAGHANRDSIGEALTDQIGVAQLLNALTDIEREAVMALAHVAEFDGDYKDAAALIGISPKLMTCRLGKARERARALWIAPGETARGHYMPAESKAVRWRYARKHRDKVKGLV